ncbi:MAG: hypothetical protein R2877_07325 [Bdellovibrionota bacterium]
MRKKVQEGEGDLEVDKTQKNGRHEECEQEWFKINEHILRKGTGVKIENISPMSRKVLSKIGGISRLGLAKSDQLPFLKREFKDAFSRD